MYEDEDTEDVDTHELVRMLKVPANKTERKPAGVDIMQAATKQEDINETLEDRTGEQKNGTTLQTKPNSDSGANEQEKMWTTPNATGKRKRKQEVKQLEEYMLPIQNL